MIVNVLIEQLVREGGAEPGQGAHLQRALAQQVTRALGSEGGGANHFGSSTEQASVGEQIAAAVDRALRGRR